MAKQKIQHPYFKTEGVMVMAHRGGGGLAPENTLIAFQQAVDLGVDGLELDIYSTADGVLVVSHDPDVDRQTDGQGLIRDYSLAALQQLDAGYNWTSDGGATHPFRGQGHVIPTLEEVFRRFGHLPISVDIKQHTPPIVKPFAAMIRDYGLEERLIVGSFDDATVEAFRRELRRTITAASESEVRRFYILHRLFLSRFYWGDDAALSIPELHEGRRIVTPRFVRDLARHGRHLHVWTVNEVDDMRRLIDWGVDGLITDYPDRLLRLLGRGP